MDWFQRIRANGALAKSTSEALLRDGFVVLSQALPADQMPAMAAAYDAAMRAAGAKDVGVGSSTTRVWDFVDRGPAFDAVWMCAPLLQAAALVIVAPFKLSSTMGRTLRARTAVQAMHTDLTTDSEDGPMLGFILMVDAFTAENGATRFLVGTDEMLACGQPGDIIVFNAAVMHGHGANSSDRDRRSIQGYFVRREVTAARKLHLSGKTAERIGEMGKWLLDPT